MAKAATPRHRHAPAVQTPYQRNEQRATNERSRKWRPRPNLADLPMEILELIGRYLVQSSYEPEMSSLRLVCRAITSKIHELFAKTFHRITVKMSRNGLCRLKGIAEHPLFDAKVEHLTFFNFDDICPSIHQWVKALNTAKSDDISDEERMYNESYLVEAGAEQEDKTFIERTASDGILLTFAFLYLPNLRKVDIPTMDNAYFGRMSVRRYLTNNGESVTRLFSTVVASMAYTQRKPKELLTSFYGCPTREEGVAVQALYLTPEIRTCVAGLQRLELHLEATDEHFKNRTTWHSYLANFLNATPQLRDLRLGFCQDWEDIANVFAPVAETVHLQAC
ncbi:hypothetical protein LTR27_010790 [Elasticomyces elasticus]|nr:hypothetical protein LTR27_010790 [Elasticomyces elasticus]